MMKIHYLIAYDIREPKRLRKVHYYISKKAMALQRSVFLVKADKSDIKKIAIALLERADTQKDDIRLYPLQGVNKMWVAGKQAEKMSGLYPAFSSQLKPSLTSRFINRLFGAKK